MDRPGALTNDDIEAVIQMATSNTNTNNNTGIGVGGGTRPVKDTRTQLFVGNLPYRVRWQDLKDLFRRAGTVLRADVSLGPDNRSRGYGTVLLATAQDAGRAIDTFNGYSWQGRVLEVRPDRLPPDYDANHPPATVLVPGPGSDPSSSTSGHGPGLGTSSSAGLKEEWDPTNVTALRSLFVGNLPFHCQWQDLKDLFRQAGTILRADVALSQDGRSRGFGTVTFATETDADRAVQMFNGYEYNGRTLKVNHDKFAQLALQTQSQAHSQHVLPSNISTYLHAHAYPHPPSSAPPSAALLSHLRSTAPTPASASSPVPSSLLSSFDSRLGLGVSSSSFSSVSSPSMSTANPTTLASTPASASLASSSSSSSSAYPGKIPLGHFHHHSHHGGGTSSSLGLGLGGLGFSGGGSSALESLGRSVPSTSSGLGLSSGDGGGLGLGSSLLGTSPTSSSLSAKISSLSSSATPSSSYDFWSHLQQEMPSTSSGKTVREDKERERDREREMLLLKSFRDLDVHATGASSSTRVSHTQPPFLGSSTSTASNPASRSTSESSTKPPSLTTTTSGTSVTNTSVSTASSSVVSSSSSPSLAFSLATGGSGAGANLLEKPRSASTLAGGLPPSLTSHRRPSSSHSQPQLHPGGNQSQGGVSASSSPVAPPAPSAPLTASSPVRAQHQAQLEFQSQKTQVSAPAELPTQARPRAQQQQHQHLHLRQPSYRRSPSSQQSHPHHPGPISLPPRPSVTSFTPLSHLHHLHAAQQQQHAPLGSPSSPSFHHPSPPLMPHQYQQLHGAGMAVAGGGNGGGNGQMMTPHGLMPITPSMPSFSFVAPPHARMPAPVPSSGASPAAGSEGTATDEAPSKYSPYVHPLPSPLSGMSIYHPATPHYFHLQSGPPSSPIHLGPGVIPIQSTLQYQHHPPPPPPPGPHIMPGPGPHTPLHPLPFYPHPHLQHHQHEIHHPPFGISPLSPPDPGAPSGLVSSSVEPGGDVPSSDSNPDGDKEQGRDASASVSGEGAVSASGNNGQESEGERGPNPQEHRQQEPQPQLPQRPLPSFPQISSPYTPLSTFSPGVAMSPGALWVGGHVGAPGGPMINPAVGAPVHHVVHMTPGHNPAAASIGVGGGGMSPGYYFGGMGIGIAPREPTGYFDVFNVGGNGGNGGGGYFPPMYMVNTSSGTGSVSSGLVNEIMKDRGEGEDATRSRLGLVPESEAEGGTQVEEQNVDRTLDKEGDIDLGSVTSELRRSRNVDDNSKKDAIDEGDDKMLSATKTSTSAPTPSASRMKREEQGGEGRPGSGSEDRHDGGGADDGGLAESIADMQAIGTAMGPDSASAMRTSISRSQSLSSSRKPGQISGQGMPPVLAHRPDSDPVKE